MKVEFQIASFTVDGKEIRVGDAVVLSCYGCLYWVQVVKLDSGNIYGKYIPLHGDGNFDGKYTPDGAFPFSMIEGILTYPA